MQEVARYLELTAFDSDDEEKDNSEQINGVERKLTAYGGAKAILMHHDSLTSATLNAFTVLAFASARKEAVYEAKGNLQLFR